MRLRSVVGDYYNFGGLRI